MAFLTTISASMDFEKFKQEVLDYTNNRKPKQWRKGQAVFNYIDSVYGVARTVQFNDKIDCFYVDDNITEFIKAAYKYIQ